MKAIRYTENQKASFYWFFCSTELNNMDSVIQHPPPKQCLTDDNVLGAEKWYSLIWKVGAESS